MRIAMLVLNDMSPDPRVERSAAFLASQDHDVRVFALRSEGEPASEKRAGFVIERVADKTTATTRQLARKIMQQRTRNRRFEQAIETFIPDVVHCHDANTLVAGGRVAHRIGAALVFDAHELYADSLVQYEFQKSWMVQRYWKRVERVWGRRADKVISVSDGSAEILAKRLGRGVTVVANVPDLQDIGDRGKLRRELDIPDDSVVVLYQGVILEAGRAVAEIVDAIERIPEAVLVVQGSGSGEKSMRRRVSDLAIEDRVFFMGHVSPSRLFEYTCGADIGTCFIDGITTNHQFTWPNRLFMYFMAGISSAVTDLPGVGGLIDEYDAGVVAAPRDVSAIEAALRKLVQDPDARARYGANGRRAAETRFNWELESQKLANIYSDIDSRRRSGS